MLSTTFLSGCTKSGAENRQTSLQDTAPNDCLTETDEEDTTKKTIEIIVNGQKYDIYLYDNETARAFADALPLTLEMKELNGNEKYHYLNKHLPTDSSMVESISCGDLMLYGSDCIVLFYKNFTTSYSYTKIGKVNNPEGLERLLGTEAITITVQIK